MQKRPFDITIELESLTSTHLESKRYYTAFFEIGQKYVEVSQKKSTSLPGCLNFNEVLTIQISPIQLENANREGKLIVSSIQNYGRKKLFGHVFFKINTKQEEQYKVKLTACNDPSAYIEFGCRSQRAETRSPVGNDSQNNFFKQVASEQDPQQQPTGATEYSVFDAFKQQLSQNRPKRQVNFSSEPKANEIEQSDQVRTTAFQLPYRTGGSASNLSNMSISKNLSLMESFETALKNMNNSPDCKDMQKSDYTFQPAISSKTQVLEKMLQMRENLNRIHQKEDLLKDDDKINDLIQEDQRSNPHKSNTILDYKDIHQDVSINSIADSQRLKLQSKIVDFMYFDKSRPARLKMDRSCSDGLKRRSLMLNARFQQIQDTPFDFQPSAKKDEPTTAPDKKLALIKPKTRKQSLQEWENDDNLVNIVHQMIDDVKGNLGYVKLSKLSQLRKKVRAIKDRNKTLLHANDLLIQTEKFLAKKLQISQKIIQEKQKILAEEFQALKQQFKGVTKKLLQKYSEEVQRQLKIKDLKRQILGYEKQVKELEGKCEHKDKQIQRLKQLLASEGPKVDMVIEIPQSEPKNAKVKAYETPTGKEKAPKFQRASSGSRLFKSRRTDSEVSRVDIGGYQGLSTELNMQNKKNVDMLKGIAPSMKDFFLTFIAQPEEPAKLALTEPPPPRGHLKKNRLGTRQKSEVAPSLNNSNMFLEI